MGGSLEVKDIHTYYGLAYVLQGVSFHINEGEAIALLGRNGEGKTTTIKSIMSLVVPQKGEIVFDGENIEGLSPHEIARKGVSVVPEGRHIFPALTVMEHLKVPVSPPDVNRAGLLADVFDIFPELQEKHGALASALSGGQQQMLVIARALMTKPKLLLLDEPMEGLAPKAVMRVIESLKKVQEKGVTVFFASTNCERAFLIANRAYIIQKGKIVYQSQALELLEDHETQQRYLGVRE